MCLVVLFSAVFSYIVFRVAHDERFDFIGTFFHLKQHEVLFVGDVMLARSVERRIHDVGEQHFFEALRPLHEQARYIIGNFEAVIPEKHQQTPDFAFHFSVDTSFVPMLARAGFTHFTLANNHSNDFGVEGRMNTVKVLSNSGFAVLGSPDEIGTTSVAYIDVDDKKIALIGLQTVTMVPNFEQVYHPN